MGDISYQGGMGLNEDNYMYKRAGNFIVIRPHMPSIKHALKLLLQSIAIREKTTL